MSVVERAWVGLATSDRVRALRGSSPVQRLLRSAPASRLDMLRRRRNARRDFRRRPRLFEDLHTVCLFVGHVKSGGSLLGALIDAHPDAVMADEVDVLDHLRQGFQRDELLHVLARNARREALKGRITARRLGGYSLAVPGQWQGRARAVEVIGETRAGPTTRRLGEDPALLEQLRDFASPAALRLIHVVRDPLDPIGAMVRRGGKTVAAACADHAAQAERLGRIRSWLEGGEYLTVHYEDLLEEPASVLGEVLAFLSLPAPSDYLAACAALVDRSRPGERRYVDWSGSDLERVAETIRSHSFLARYASSTRRGPVSP